VAFKRSFSPVLDGAAVNIGDGTVRTQTVRIESGEYTAPIWLRTEAGLVVPVGSLPYQGILRVGALEVLSQEPSPSSFLNVNRPVGLTTVIEDDFDYAISTGNRSAMTAEFQAQGWSTVIFDAADSGNENRTSTVDMSGTPNGVGTRKVLSSFNPTGTGGTGSFTLRKSFSSAQIIYVYVTTWYEPGFHHNSVSEKLIYLNQGVNGIWEHGFEDEVLNGIPQDPIYCGIDSHCWANLLPCGSGGSNPVTGFQSDGVWRQFEILLNRTTGSVKWWTDGEQRADHIGRTFSAGFTSIDLDNTWGGGGSKIGNHARRHDFILVATGN
jgi:hypothetical protein